ncbi:hypothetical protein [Bacillus sp. FSL K6-3431]
MVEVPVLLISHGPKPFTVDEMPTFIKD